MKINNQVSGTLSSTVTGDSAPEIKSGDVLQAVVKEKSSNNEAVIQTRGREMRVQLEGIVPAAGESVLIAVKQIGHPIIGKVLDPNGPETNLPAPNPVSGKSTENYSADELKVSKMLRDKGVMVNREGEVAIRTFLRAASGELSQKLATVQAVIQKGLPLTPDHLSAVHAALSGPSVSSLLNELTGGPKLPISVEFKPSAQPTSPSRSKGDDKLDEQAQQILKLLADKGIKVTAKQEAAIRGFWDAASGTESHKVATVQLALQEKGGLTTDLLLALHKAANNTPVDFIKTSGTSVTNLMLGQATNTSLSDPAGLHIDSSMQHIVQAILEQWGQTNGESATVLTDEVVEKQEGVQSSEKTHQAFQAMSKVLKPDSRLGDVIYHMKGLLPSLDSEQAAHWDNTIQSLRKLQLAGAVGQGREMVHQFIQEGLSSSAPHFPAIEFSADTDDRQETAYSAAVTGQIGISSRSILVTEVTKRLSEANQEFTTLKRDITRNLTHIAEILKSSSRNMSAQVQAALGASIDKLDKAILQSNVTMLTDMGTEKQLLLASSRLADARKQIQLGHNAEARAILEEVTSKLEQMKWRPANVKVENLLYRQQISKEDTSSAHKLAAQWDNIISSSTKEHTARSVSDTIRAMGYSHDSDAARYLASTQDNGSASGNRGQQEHQHNMKALLLKLVQEDQGVAVRTAEQALNNLTGQQLLSKQDLGASIQSLMFSLPLMLSGKAENVKVTVNSRQEGEKVDWENCSLYFALQTRRMGDLGILVSVTDRHLSLTLKNDHPHFQERMEPLTAMCRDKLREVGFHTGPIRYTPLSPTEQISSEPTVAPSASAPNPLLKGFDYKV